MGLIKVLNEIDPVAILQMKNYLKERKPGVNHQFDV